MLRQVCRRASSLPCAGRKSIFTARRNPAFSALVDLQDNFRHMEKQIDQVFKQPWGPGRDWWWGGNEWVPVRSGEWHPTSVELYRLRNPIVEEEGIKKMKLEFDVRRFTPEEVIVKTTSKDNTLSIEAKHDSETAKFEYSRQFTLPDGVKADEVTCRYKADGTLLVEAPFTAPPEPTPIQDTEISVKHE